ncbi:dioxygenase family protein [Ferviditalea candida]|uniref:Dioxygenase n=1 Tax=Ferviditalea candida TaxID=3108399 RepID=A0ABU5ZMG0_9BACL|nr:dioxygenase [Paenibacillaceae bacterium T2]
MDQRLSEVTTKLVQQLQLFMEESRITETELSKALQLLTEVGQHNEFQLLSDVLGISVLVDNITHGVESDGIVTDHNVLGPLYREEAPFMELPAVICREDEEGTPLYISGQVISAATGAPLANAIVDVWQANEKGYYENQDEDQPDFNLRGRMRTDEQGRYEIRTIVPGPYDIAKGGPVGRLLHALGRHDWRPAHIHFKVSCEGHVPLTTMLFVPGDPYLGSDAIGAVKHSLIMNMERHDDPEQIQERGLNKPFCTCRYDFKLKQPQSVGKPKLASEGSAL